MDSDELIGKVKTFLTKGAAQAMTAFEKAGDKVQDFSDKSVVRLEKKQLESKRDVKYRALGQKISEYILDKKLEIPEEISVEIDSLQKEIIEFTAQIKEKADLLEKSEAEKN